jgi:hypothetical protein
MNRKKDKKEFFHCKLVLEIRKKPYKKEWIELEDKVK